MEDFSDSISSFQSIIPFARSLKLLSDTQWSAPLQPGKWSVCGVMGHILLWDRHYMDEAITPIASGTPLNLRHTDFNLFNRQAAEYAATIPQAELIEACISQRQQLIHVLESLSPVHLETIYTDSEGKPFTIQEYLKDFIDHDRHHSQQIEQFLSRQ